MEEKSVMQDQRTITFTEFITKFIPFTIRIPYILYHGIKGLNMISGKKNISWGLLLEKTAEKYPNNIAIKSHEGTLTYKELNEKANKFAHFLKSKNIVKGDTVTLCIDTRPELLVLYCGCTKIGHDPVAYIYTSGTTGGLPKAAVIT
ncbi:MAG TPA: AMP-binding protein [Spirochaetota bacterium]|nr:AMP-binding protein [Spirochaetota bacterium]